MNIEKLLHEWRSSVEEYASAKAEAEYLSHFRKSKIAILMTEAEVKEGIKAANAQDRYARAHPEYQELLLGLKAAVEKSELFRMRMKIAEQRVEVWRTNCANNRKEKGMYGA